MTDTIIIIGLIVITVLAIGTLFIRELKEFVSTLHDTDKAQKSFKHANVSIDFRFE